MRATWLMGEPVEGEIPGGACVWMARRDAFDHFLVQKAVEAGASLFEGTAALSGAWEDGAWRLGLSLSASAAETFGPDDPDGAPAPNRGDHDSLAARFVIAADGAKGQTAKWLGFKERRRLIAGALEAEAPLATAQDGVIHLEFGLIQGGYLWNFPKADGHSIGIGAFKGSAPKNMRELLAEYSRSFRVDLASASQHGHPVAVWDGHQRLHGRNALLAGEAACLVDPFTAEGIRAAIFSGMKAAEAVHEALGGDASALGRYSATIRREHGIDMAWARRIARLFYTFPRVAYDHGVKDPAALGFMGKLLTGQARYRDVAHRGIATLSRGLGRRLA
jgi:flavin-dependent dehydrogenase